MSATDLNRKAHIIKWRVILLQICPFWLSKENDLMHCNPTVTCWRAFLYEREQIFIIYGATAVYLFRHVFVAFPIQISFFSFALIWSENVRIKELGPKADWGQNGWNFLDPVPICDGILYFRARAAARAGKADWGDTLLAHVIWRISACIPKTGFRFQLMDEVKIYFGLWLLDDRGNLQFLLYNFGVQIIPLNWRNWKKTSKEKKREQIVFTKPVTRWCK